MERYYPWFAGHLVWKYVQRQRFLSELRIACITPEELKKMLDSGEDLMIVDVRSSLELEAEPQRMLGLSISHWNTLKIFLRRSPPTGK